MAKCVNLWHQRFGQLSSKSIASTSTKRFVEELPKFDQSDEQIPALCTGCLLGKFEQRPFHLTAKKAASVYEKDHIDIKGPIDLIFIGK